MAVPKRRAYGPDRPHLDPSFGRVGDSIIAADGQRTQTAVDLAAVSEQAGVGHEVTLRIVRGDAERDVKVRLIDFGT